jgi:hypothetical protein
MLKVVSYSNHHIQFSINSDNRAIEKGCHTKTAMYVILPYSVSLQNRSGFIVCVKTLTIIHCTKIITFYEDLHLILSAPMNPHKTEVKMLISLYSMLLGVLSKIIIDDY